MENIEEKKQSQFEMMRDDIASDLIQAQQFNRPDVATDVGNELLGVLDDCIQAERKTDVYLGQTAAISEEVTALLIEMNKQRDELKNLDTEITIELEEMEKLLNEAKITHPDDDAYHEELTNRIARLTEMQKICNLDMQKLLGCIGKTHTISKQGATILGDCNKNKQLANFPDGPPRPAPTSCLPDEWCNKRKEAMVSVLSPLKGILATMTTTLDAIVTAFMKITCAFARIKETFNDILKSSTNTRSELNSMRTSPPIIPTMSFNDLSSS